MPGVKSDTVCDNKHERGHSLHLAQVLARVKVPAHTMSKRIPLWEDDAGLGLFFA